MANLPVQIRTDARWDGLRLMPDQITITLVMHRGENLAPLEIPMSVSQAEQHYRDLETTLRNLASVFPVLARDDDDAAA